MVRAMPGPVRLMVFEGFGRGYGAVVSVPQLKKGDTHPEVVRIRGYLASILTARSQPIAFDAGTSTLFDAALERAVLQFQTDEGLGVDGVVGTNTWARLFELANPSDTPVVGGGGGNINDGDVVLTVPKDTSPKDSWVAYAVAGAAALGLLWAINKGRK